MLAAPRGDLRRTTERVPSRWLLDVVGELSGAGRRLPSSALVGSSPVDDRPWLVGVPSFAAAVAALDVDGAGAGEPVRGQAVLDFPPPGALPAATVQEVRLHQLPDRGAAVGVPLLRADPVVRAGLRLQAARDSAAFTEFDGNLSGLPVPRPSDGRLVSPTQLEGWAYCPFGYFLERVLGVREVEDPEDVLELSPLQRGSLVHHAIDLFMIDVLGREGGPPAPDQRWTDADRQVLSDAFERACAAMAAEGRVGPELLWRREQHRTWAEVLRFLEHDDERRRDTRSSPVASELHFGFDDSDVGTVVLELDDGRTVTFRGSIDRVDRADDGALLVVDYKTGKPQSFRRISQDDPTVGASKLQLPVYALAAQAWAGPGVGQPVRTDYWFTAGEAAELVGIDVDATVLATFGRVVGGIDDQIGAGTFPGRPEESFGPWVRCRACDPDGLGTAEGRRAWERKRHDPALADYLALVEPPDDDETDAATAAKADDRRG